MLISWAGVIVYINEYILKILKDCYHIQNEAFIFFSLSLFFKMYFSRTGAVVKPVLKDDPSSDYNVLESDIILGEIDEIGAIDFLASNMQTSASSREPI